MTTEKNRQILLALRRTASLAQTTSNWSRPLFPRLAQARCCCTRSISPLTRTCAVAWTPGPHIAAGRSRKGDGRQRRLAVVKSNLPPYQAGDIVVAGTGWQEYSLSDGEGVQKVDPALGPISYALGVLGMPGLTAYTGLLNIGKPQPGETLVVAAASGAVGSVVGQIAKVKGCRVIGIAGGEQKCRFVKEELGFDGCLDHRQPDLAERLQAACPNGIDIYFENVGGAVFDAVLPLLNNFARIPVCGLIAHYNATELPAGPDRVPLLMRNILAKRLTFRGFIVFDHGSQFGDFITDMSVWLRDGQVKYREDITDGLENAPRELVGLLKGENFGKKIIRVSPDPTKR